jgi:phage regulator Rha-like protein
MGATEILEQLQKGDKLTSFEIADRSGCSLSSVKQAIKRLLSDVSENVEFRKLTPEEKETKYGHKISCKVYIYWLED